MKSFATVAALLAAASLSMGQQMQVNSLSGVVECEPVLISWTGGTAPYYLSLIPAGQPSASAIKQFPPQQGTSLTWNVDLPSGTSFTTELKDSTGQIVYSGTQNIEAGSSTSCVNTSVMEGTASGTATTSPGAAAANPSSSATQPAGASTTGTASTTGAASHAASSGASSATHASLAASGSSASPSATQNAAVRGSSVGVYGLTGLLGFIGAVFF